MYRIYAHDERRGEHGRGISDREFRVRFNEICQQHRRDGIALAFAFLLHRLEDVEVVRALKDEDYWNALDEISGRFISVFVFYSTMGKPELNDSWVSKKPKKDVRASTAQGLLQQHFSMEQSLKLPCILFFQVRQERVVDSYMVPLSRDTIEATFSQIREVLDTARKALAGVRYENKENAQEIFNLIRMAMDNLSLRKTILKGGVVIGTAIKLAGVLVKLVGAGPG